MIFNSKSKRLDILKSFFFLAVGMVFTANINPAFAQPANDNCANASVISIGSSGFALGTFTSTQIDISAATVQVGETFAPGILTGGLSKKSIWYKFTLPTTRGVEVFLKQPAVAIADGNVGFAVYKANTCMPGDAQISTKLTPIAKFASSKYPCLEAGEYYVQVSANDVANGLVFISLELAEPDPAPHDKPATASKFGKLAVNFTTSVEFAVGCQSIDNVSEVCLANSSFKDYTQSTWHTFTTPDYSDYIALMISGNGSNPGNHSKTKIGFRLFEGDVSTTPLASLTQIGGCDSLTFQNNATDYRLYKCGTFKTNTTYSVQLLYPTSFTNIFRFYVRQGGTAPTLAPQPLISIPAANKMGILPSSYAGITTNAPMDVFACNAMHSNYACPKAMPVEGIPAPYNSNLRFNLSTFYSFTLANTANVKLNATGGLPYLRLYQQGLVNTCADLDTSKILAHGNDLDVSCLPPGDYVVQVMGADSFLNAGLLVGHLGINAGFRITVSSIPAINKFSLNAPGAFEKINANGAGFMQPLEINKIYSTTPDTLGCANTVLPDVNCGVGDQKASYRQFLVGDSSIFRMEEYTRNWNFTSLYKGDANALAISQNAFSFPKLITGLVPMRTCMNYYDFVRETATCITPGTFSLVGFGPLNVGYINNFNVTIQEPRFSIIAPKAKHITPQTAQNMGDLWAQLGPGGGLLSSDLDTFSCYDNPAIIDGLDGCIRGPYKATKLIYRQFYLSQPSSIRIATGPHATYPRYGVLTLFSGKATDGLNGLKAVGSNWTCFADVNNAGSCTDLMPAGWYTVVAYGHGGNYQDPSQANNVVGGSCVGQPSSFYVWLYPQTCASPKFNRPHKASVDTVTKKPYVVDWAPRPGHTAAYPATYQTYTLNKENFDCTQDTAFIKQHIGTCNASDVKVAFYVFQITKESYVKIGRLEVDGAIWSRVYAFDVRSSDSLKLKTEAPLQPCLNGWGHIELCKLQPGFYTLVLFAPSNYNCNAITPTVYVDQVGFSRFDHANKAYDFGTLKPDSVWYNGKIGDVNPLNSSRAPSNDFFYCTTGAQEKDPNAASCNFIYNPNIYPAANNKVLNPDNNKATTDPNINRRNLWYTFSINQPGLVRVRVALPTPGKDIMGGYSIYKSDVDGTLPFSSVVAGGMVDSTALQGLTLVANSFGNKPCFGLDFPRPSPELAFYVNPCNFKPTRYYIILDNSNTYYWPWAEAMRPNYQAEVSVLLSNISFSSTKFDHYTQANDLGLVNSGKKKGAVDNFTCATKDLTDPTNGNSLGDGGASCKKTLWYKFTTTVTGTIRYAAFLGNTYQYHYNYIQLFRQIKPNDSTSIGLQHLPYTSSHSFNGNWAQQCISPGTYYILLPGCNVSTEDVFPEIEIIPSAGDFCSNPMIANLNGVGSKVVPVTVDCHTIGTDYGEFNPTLTCPANALTKDYKTSWYRLDIGGTDTLDLTVFINEKTNAGSTDVKYRMMTGSCGAMQEQSCVQDALTRNTYECMIPGKSYYIQVFTPVLLNGNTLVVGDIELNIAAVKHVLPCAPANNCIAVAEFTPNFDCTKDQNMTVTNLSTFGSDIKYDWDFGYNNAKSNAVSPEFFYPALTTDKTYTIKLVVTNLVCGKQDAISKTIIIPARPSVNLGNDTIICSNPALVKLDATSHAGTTYQWYYWYIYYFEPYSKAATVDVASPNRIFVELTYNNCKARDTVNVWLNPIDPRPLQTVALCNSDKVILDAWRDKREVFQWNDGSSNPHFTVTQPGFYWCDLYLNGCTIRDSFLVVNPAATQQVKKVNVCQNNLPYLADATVSGATAYKWSDNSANAKLNITKSGIYWVDITLSGCKYRDTLIVTIDSFKTAAVTARLCGGQSYTMPTGKVISIAGIYKDTIRNVRGCDSIITTVNLIVDTVKKVNSTVSICAGQSYTLPSGQAVSVAGGYADTVRYKTSNCDSLITNINLTVATVSRISQTATICAGSMYQLPSGKNVNTAAIYADTLRAQAGCDSVIYTIDLRVDVPLISGLTTTICNGNSYTLPSGRVVTIAGLYRDTIRNVRGCDSAITNVTLKVDVVNIQSSNAYFYIGQTYTLPWGRVTNVAGIYRDTLKSVAGCDSLITIVDLRQLTVQSNIRQAVICTGGSYSLPWGGRVNRAGSYADTIKSVTGADSLLNIVELMVLPRSILTPDSTVCQDAVVTLRAMKALSYTWSQTTGLGGANNEMATWTATIDRQFHLTTTHTNPEGGTISCNDSVQIKVVPKQLQNQSLTICFGQIHTLPSGIIVNTSGIYRDTVRSTAGCDSLISTIDLTVQSSVTKSISASVCEGQTYLLPSGKSISATGIYSDTLRYTTGCDSAITVVTLTKFSVTERSETVTICLGNQYTLPSGKRINSAGTFRDTLRYANGCDSMRLSLTLQVTDAKRESLAAHICLGNTFRLPSGRSISVAGIYNDTLRTALGCDSLISSVTLITDAAANQTLSATICSKETYTFPSGRKVNANGNYLDTIYNVRGCDSIRYTINVTVIATKFGNASALLCAGQGYTLPSGKVVNIAGTYMDTIRSSINGCDSVITTTLTYQPVLTVSLNAPLSVCVGSSAILTANATGGNGGPYTYTWTGVTANSNTVSVTPTATTKYKVTVTDGCTVASASDSVTIQLTSFPLPGLNNASIQICRGSSMQLNARGGTIYQWTPVTGLSNAAIANPTASPLTDTRYKVTVTTADGCKGEDSLLVKVVQPFTLTTSRDTAVCIGNAVNLTASGALRYEWSGAGLSINTGATTTARPATSTTYAVTGFGIDNCFTQTKNILVTVVALPQVNAGPDTAITFGTSITLQPVYGSGITNYRWTPGTALSCTNCAQPTAQPKEPIDYTITVRNNYGCESSDQISIRFLCSIERVYLPTGFTPNNDGLNDVWYPLGGGSLKVNYLKIFNRWGQLVFERTNILTNDRSTGWDGSFKGQPLPTGVFAITMGVSCENGQVVEMKGSVKLLR